MRKKKKFLTKCPQLFIFHFLKFTSKRLSSILPKNTDRQLENFRVLLPRKPRKVRLLFSRDSNKFPRLLSKTLQISKSSSNLKIIWQLFLTSLKRSEKRLRNLTRFTPFSNSLDTYLALMTSEEGLLS